MGQATELPFQFEFVAPPADIAQRVNAFYVVRTQERTVEEIMPAYSAQMQVFITGSAEIRYASGETGHSSTTVFNAPLLQAAPFTIHGPACIVGASLTPIGWAALTDLPVNKVHDCTIDAASIIEKHALQRLALLAGECASGAAEPKALTDAMGGIIRDAQHQLKPEHIETIEQMNDWLASGMQLDTDALYAKTQYSDRQVQRLSKRYFGVPPARVAKRQRAIRAAMLLSREDLPDEYRDEIITAYFDQAHLIKDLRRYTGRTPSALSQESLANRSLDPVGHGSSAQILRSA